ncbi:BrnA antitoxin family protein (plasmid) [Paracoccus liaowanqingii]|uniref:BrnA antitoxin family protein n=2 Tax=Paracoccus liaowanqingii TaxID=2560053 RepID=A0A4Y5STH5_9RHOB|nr:BrnA antitoxin family protein [Paracoccus liaowanqingii]
MSLEEVRKLRSETRWDEVRATGDHQGDSEIEVDWRRVEVVLPEKKVMISVRLDADVLDFLRSQGPGYQSRMNAILRSYMKSHEKA